RRGARLWPAPRCRFSWRSQGRALYWESKSPIREPTHPSELPMFDQESNQLLEEPSPEPEPEPAPRQRRPSGRMASVFAASLLSAVIAAGGTAALVTGPLAGTPSDATASSPPTAGAVT